jgi:hypothetical protein
MGGLMLDLDLLRSFVSVVDAAASAALVSEFIARSRR